MSNTPDSTTKRNPIKEIFEPFVNLVHAPRALWGINVPFFLEGLVYFGILTILGKFLSENVALTDLHAGWVYSAFTGGITFAMFFLGGVSDRIGVRVALILALGFMLVGRLLLALSGSLGLGTGLSSAMFVLILGGLFLVVIGWGMFQPAAYAGVKKFTTPATATMGYAMVYALMNLGAFMSGIISPPVRRAFVAVFPPNGLTAVFWVYVGLTFLALAALITLLTPATETKAIHLAQAARTDTAEKPPAKSKINNLPLIIYAVLLGLSLAGALELAIVQVGVLRYLRWLPVGLCLLLMIIDFLKRRPEHPFWNVKFLFFIFILIPVQTLFAHNWLTIPYYIDRAFHGSTVGANFEFFSNLNPILIFFLTPIVAAFTAKVNVYKMMIIGTFTMALPTFLLVLGPNPVLLLIFILFLSIGEAMWQPRFLQWVAEIAPPGQTGAYMGIAQFPWFLTKVVTGLYSGWLLTRYCPKPGTGEQHTEILWLIYAIIALISPIMLLLARNWMLAFRSGPAAAK